jgi:hypothetical protein
MLAQREYARNDPLLARVGEQRRRTARSAIFRSEKRAGADPSRTRLSGRELPKGPCNEVEIGTTVVVNSGAAETKLAMPFGVAEGDDCITQNPLGTFPVPAYFDTTAAGAVPATITITGGPPFIITIHKLHLAEHQGQAAVASADPSFKQKAPERSGAFEVTPSLCVAFACALRRFAVAA